MSIGKEQTKQDQDCITKTTRQEFATRLLQLKRYNAGTADDGGGYLYDYANESKSGRWVEWEDIQKLIDEFSV